MTQHPTFQVLFYFSNASNGLIEVKKCDVAADTPPGGVFFWLYCDGDRKTLQRLDFRSMAHRGVQQQRVFAQGALRFDDAQAHLRWTDATQDEVFQVCSTQDLPADWAERVRTYLLSH